MLDNTQLHILHCLCRYFEEHSAFYEIDFRNQFTLFDRHGLIELLETLKDEGYVKKLVISHTKDIIDVRLSYKGKTYFRSKYKTHFRKIVRWLCDLVGAELISSVIK